jgi:hypothetical protein
MASRLDQALALADAGFFVFPLLPGRKTPAAGMRFKELATRDEACIRQWFESTDSNIGIYTGKYGDHGEALLVVDVDNKGKAGHESILRLELDGYDFPATRRHTTPTGGYHLLYVVADAVKQGANVLGPGVDVRSRGGYVVACGSRLEIGDYAADHTPLARAPEWLVERIGLAVPHPRDSSEGAQPAIPRPSAIERSRHYLELEAPKGEAGNRNHTGYKVAARVRELGASQVDCLALMGDLWPCEPPLDEAELAHVVKSAYTYANSAPGSAAPEADFTPIQPPASKVEQSDEKLGHPFDKLNAEYAFVIAGGGSHILWETTDHRGSYKLEHLASGTFHAKHAAKVMQVGKRSAPVTEEWMRWKGRRSYDGIVFMPGLQAPERFYNLWKGFTVEPAPTAEPCPAVDAWLEHLRENICGGDTELARWLTGFFAHMVQRPWEKPLVALVLRGGKGVGKNALVRTVGALLGGHALLSSNRRYLVGNFNGHLENLLLFTLDEAFWSGDKQAEGQLKDLITGDHHVIEHKGKEPYTVENRTRIVVLGNEDWLVPASHDERRFAVFDVGDGRKQDRSFFSAMREGMEAGGARLLLRHLLDFDIRGLDFNGAPTTAGLMEQKHASLDAFPGWWLTCLTEGKLVGGDFEVDWPGEATKERFRNAFRRYAKDRNVRGWIPDDRSMGRALKKFAPSVGVGRLATGHTYKLPTLEKARAEWNTFIGHAVTWE